MSINVFLRKHLRPYAPLLRKAEGKALSVVQSALAPLKALPVSSAVFGPPKGLYQTTESWFREHPDISDGAAYQKLSPAVMIERQLIPKTIHDAVFAGFEKHRRWSRPETFIATIPNCRFWGHYGGCFISPDDRLLGDVSPDVRGLEMHAAFRKMKLPKLQRWSGTTCAVTTPEAAETYGHWLLEAIPRFVMLRNHGIDFSDIDRFVVNWDVGPSELRLRQEESLRLLGIAPERVIPNSKSLHVEAERLIYPSLTTRSIVDIDPATVALLKGAIPADQKCPGRGVRLYATRSGASFRRVLNEPEVIAALDRRGFKRLDLYGLSLREQAAIFQRAEAVVGVISSGLSNVTLFCITETL